MLIKVNICPPGGALWVVKVPQRMTKTKQKTVFLPSINQIYTM